MSKKTNVPENQADNAIILLNSIRQAAESNGGLGFISRQTGLSRESLYRALSSKGNPTIKTLCSTLNSIGLQLVIEPIQEKKDFLEK